MAVSAEERIKQLIDLEKNKRKEIEDKKKELEKKKKEVEELERAGNKQIQDARKEIDAQIEEIFTEEQKRFEEEETLTRRRRDQKSLEEKLGGASEEAPKFKGYGEAIEQVMRGTPNFYNITNYNVVNRLESLASEARNRPLTDAEKDFVQIVEYHAKHLSKDDFYKDHQGAVYLKQELAKIDSINKMAKRQGEYRT
jgi:hypothetical protein